MSKTIRITTIQKDLKNDKRVLDKAMNTNGIADQTLNNMVEHLYQDFAHSKYMQAWESIIIRTHIRTAQSFLPAKDSMANDDYMCLDKNDPKRIAYIRRVKYVKNFKYKWFLCVSNRYSRKQELPNHQWGIVIDEYPISRLRIWDVHVFVSWLLDAVKQLRSGMSCHELSNEYIPKVLGI